MLASAIQLGLGKGRGDKEMDHINDILFIILGCAAGLGILVFLMLPIVEAPPEILADDEKAPSPGSQLEGEMLLKEQQAGQERSSTASNIQRRSVERLPDAVSAGHLEGGLPNAFAPDEKAHDAKQRVACCGSSQSQSKDDGPGLLQTLSLAVSDPRMTLLLPNILYNGMSLGFFFGDYASFYTANGTDRDLLPKSYVGFVTASFYLVNAIASWSLGMVVNRVGRRGTTIIAICSHIAFFAVLLILLSIARPENGSLEAFLSAFAPQVLFALGDAVWES